MIGLAKTGIIQVDDSFKDDVISLGIPHLIVDKLCTVGDVFYAAFADKSKREINQALAIGQLYFGDDKVTDFSESVEPGNVHFVMARFSKKQFCLIFFEGVQLQSKEEATADFIQRFGGFGRGCKK